ncbi:MAG: YceI family protein [Alphaproteobacteria bacterium]|jgi:polyisoprenoid-binding protein YceI
MIRRTTRPRRTALLACALLLAGAATAAAEPREYEIDREHFSIGFMVSHIGYERMLGMFLEGGGTFVYDAEAGTVADVEVVIAADSVFTNHERRDRHVRGSDFLNAGEFPEIVFTGAHAEKTGAHTGIVHGTLAMLGTTRPVAVEVTLNKAAPYPFGHKKHTLGISARATLKRSDFGMTYAVEGDLVGDAVDLIFEFEAIPR